MSSPERHAHPPKRSKNQLFLHSPENSPENSPEFFPAISSGGGSGSGGSSDGNSPFIGQGNQTVMHHNSYPSSSFPPFPTARGSPPLYMPNSHFSDFQQNTLKVLRSHFHFLKKSTGNFNLIFCRLHKHDETLFVVNFHNFLGTLTTSFEFHQYSIIMDQPDNLGDI